MLQVNAVVKPRSTAEVVSLVQHARATGQPLYPISRGMNWGYGGAAPVVAGCTVVDLSAMDRIRNAAAISLTNPVALVEPGVTQGQLHDQLVTHAPGLGFNVTGSARASSLVGNALERGVGYLGPRMADLFGLEVVLGTGEVIQTGFRRLGETSPLAYSHPHGLGPIADGLFFQGNFGIVTSACFRLVRKRPHNLVLSLNLTDASRLGLLIQHLIDLKRDGLLSSVAHVGNAARARATLRAGLARYLSERCAVPAAALEHEIERALQVVAASPWTGLVGVSGNRLQCRAALMEISGRLRGIATVRTFGTGLLKSAAHAADALRAVPRARSIAAALSAVSPLQQLVHGIPTDIAFESLLWQFEGAEVSAIHYQESRCGVLFVNPAVPLDGAYAADMVKILAVIAGKYGHELSVTVNLESDQSMAAVINLSFDTADHEQVQRAHACSAAMLAHLHAEGLELYRARTDQMTAVTSRNPEHWALLERLKQAWDPDGIIAPGRYLPVPSPN